MDEQFKGLLDGFAPDPESVGPEIGTGALPEGSPEVRPEVAHVLAIGNMQQKIRNQICSLARILFLQEEEITAVAISNLWPERAMVLEFGFDVSGPNKAEAPTVNEIQEYLLSEDYFMKMAQLGIALDVSDDGLTAKQISFLTLLSNITDTTPPAQKLKKVGATWLELQAWQFSPAFRKAYAKLGGDAVKAAIPLAELALASRMAHGDQKATEFGFAMTGHFDPAKNKQIDAQKLFAILLEIIEDNVKDPVILHQIGQDVQLKAMRALEP
ncbi:hypothetical protein FDG92_gp04 [Arthrobacter phage Jasmine]|uniref:Uncharacterized protein n=1 Tax=Arthrobacter phage Jasmine TaxID=1772302 RepID=A0A0U4K014_9CAUD|nr:hypothetical protein FDG92_gp04 [Arthrobacter phage Jasmine]ALY09276.1 hypothetical protein JASMINE_4 [Arthrobacter phage Jasmine]